MEKEWFETWFDTHYYHLLYKHRDENEARQFIDALLSYLSPSPNAKFLDVACGKGRHSIQINNAGYAVTGVDLSENSIRCASEFSGPNLNFEVRDIRQSLGNNTYDYALNLFTSFGYFKSSDEHLLSLKNIYNSLKYSGCFVLDYLNRSHVEQNFQSTLSVQVDNVDFAINKSIDGVHFSKKIDAAEDGITHHYEERVMAFSKGELEDMVKEVGFEIVKVFGDYDLTKHNSDAPRVIIIAKK